MFNNTQTSGKVVAATFFGVALISFALWKTFFTHVSPLDEEITAVNSKNILESEVYLKDSDNDGVYDWEEALFGTDPHNPDTDGDGISDSEEIAVTRKSYEENLEAGADVIVMGNAFEHDPSLMIDISATIHSHNVTLNV